MVGVIIIFFIAAGIITWLVNVSDFIDDWRTVCNTFNGESVPMSWDQVILVYHINPARLTVKSLNCYKRDTWVLYYDKIPIRLSLRDTCRLYRSFKIMRIQRKENRENYEYIQRCLQKDLAKEKEE